MVTPGRLTVALLAVPVALLLAAGSRADFAPGTAAQQETASGTLHVVWGDPPSGPPILRVFQVEDDGSVRELIGTDAQLRAATHAHRGRDAAAAPVLGSQPFANIACKFPDVFDEPRSIAWFDGLMGSSAPQMDHYWRDVSYDNVNIAGSGSFGWFDLPKPKSEYVGDFDGDGKTDTRLGDLATDCALAADPFVDFTPFVGINFMFNDWIGCCAWGGGYSLALDGPLRGFRTTWMPTWAYNSQSVMGHEMGHTFGLPHSSGPYGAIYDSQWDVMSSGGACRVRDPVYGCTGPHTISYHKDKLGWIPAPDIYAPVYGSSQVIELAYLDDPAPGPEYLMARIPIDADSFYTVEARQLVGYDDDVPYDAVLINNVDPARGQDAHVVDPDGNGDPNDLGAAWFAGEAFVDTINLVAVHVLGTTAAGYEVEISYGTLPSPTVSVTVAGDGRGFVTSEPAGIDCGPSDRGPANQCAANFLLTTEVRLTAAADSSDPAYTYAFDGWTGACQGGITECVIDVMADDSVTAAFVVIPPTIELPAEPVLFTTMQGLVDPAPVELAITNVGGSPLDDLSVASVDYSGTGGWLAASLGDSIAPTTLTLTPSTDGLAPGTYSATVTIASAAATNSPRSVAVTLSLTESVTMDQLMATLFDGAALPGAARDFVDDLGNANGLLDVGDILAWIEANEAAPGPGRSRTPGDKR